MPLRDHLRILVVDDMSTSRGILGQSMEALGLRNVTIAVDGNDALRALASNPVHLVISDYNMPSMNGLELLQHLRATQKTKDVGFIMITGTPDQRIIDQGVKLRMNNYLTKPFDLEGLKNCIETVVGRL